MDCWKEIQVIHSIINRFYIGLVFVTSVVWVQVPAAIVVVVYGFL